MNEVDEIRRLLARCSDEQRRKIFDELRHTIQPHPFETRMNASVEVILEALNRAQDLSIRGIRGLIGEATFVLEIIPTLEGWQDVTPPGDLPYDAALRDSVSTVTVQVKMQRRLKGVPLLKKGNAIVEVQRTRSGTGRDGVATRPYRYGEFDILAVCMEPSHGRWNSFFYVPERLLKPRLGDAALIDVLQPVSLAPDEIWTNDFKEAVRRLRSEKPLRSVDGQLL